MTKKTKKSDGQNTPKKISKQGCLIEHLRNNEVWRKDEPVICSDSRLE